ncbi:hypothetical protein [Archaeoglobus neptunius]|uniref:hypothetical protein n=1 Tax=Archaeoglobus neptunius TaxID=2798580 RepID=UPI001925720B|nr:hypothetical protein [Archaeoglobus neptunius]
MKKIEHELTGWQLSYGYIRWLKKEDEKFKEIFPEEEEVEIILEGENIGGKKADWNMRRISIGKKLKEKYNDGDIVEILRQNNKIYINKKGRRSFVKSAENSNGIKVPLIERLRESQRNSDDPTLFEKLLTEAFKILGFNDAKHLGGKDEADIIISKIPYALGGKF